jgi:predicted Zn-dependent protease
MNITRHKPLSAADARVVEAAKGWCELHAFDEAERELRQIDPENQRHPEVLEALWQILMNLEQWEQALEAATSIRSLEPEQRRLHQQRAFHRRLRPSGGLRLF